MFVRAKRSVQNGAAYEYLQVVESFRDRGKPRQRVIATLGRRDVLVASGMVDGLLRSLAKFSEKLRVVEVVRTQGLVARSYKSLWRVEERDMEVSWPDLMRDLSQVQAVRVELDGRSYVLRTDLSGVAHEAFVAAGVRPPPTVTALDKLRAPAL